jgi:glycosyltransferase involved in cell wall biosynthesis
MKVCSEPFFSVIITTFNREKLIPRAINSLLNQIETDWEAIIIDDGSTDNSQKIINEIIEGNSKFYYYKIQHSGNFLAKQSGIEKSQGIYFTFLDSDDEYLPEHLFVRKQFLLENKEIDLLHGGVKIVGNEFVPDFYNPGNQIHLKNCVIGGTFFIKRESFNKIGYFANKIFGDDTEFFENARKMKFNIVEINLETYIYHRDTEDSICNLIEKGML